MSSKIHSSCNQILHTVRTSNLNYSCQETPFSLFLTIRKSPVKFYNQLLSPPQDCQVVHSVPSNVSENLITAVTNENADLKNDLKNTEIELEASKEVTKTLEEKLTVAEAKLINEFNKVNKRVIQKDDEIKNLKNVISKNNLESTKLNNELNMLKKNLKLKEKDIYNLENDKLKKQETIKDLKIGIAKIKEEKSKQEKKWKKSEKKMSDVKTAKNNNLEPKIVLSSPELSITTSSIATQTVTSVQSSSSNPAPNFASIIPLSSKSPKLP